MPEKLTPNNIKFSDISGETFADFLNLEIDGDNIHFKDLHEAKKKQTERIIKTKKKASQKALF